LSGDAKKYPFRTLKVSGKRHRVRWDQSMGDLAGNVNHQQLLILISAGMSADEVRETLLHELLHAVCHQQGVDIKEDANRQISIGIFELMRSNPGLADYIFGESDDGSD